MKEIITLLYFQIYLNIIGLTVYYESIAEVTHPKSRFLKVKPTYKLSNTLISQC